MFGRTNISYYTLPEVSPEQQVQAIRENVARWLHITAGRMIHNTEARGTKFEVNDQVLLPKKQTGDQLFPYAMCNS